MFLSAFRDWVPLSYPIRSEVIGDVKRFDAGEAQRTQLLICGANIGTFVPRAAPAIDDEKATVLQVPNALSECLKSCILSSGTDILRTEDMCLGVEDMRADLQDQRFLAVGSVQNLHEFRRLQ